MASDYVLVIDGIQGEALDAKHKHSIEVDSFHFGASNTGSFQSGTGGGTAKATFHDMSLTSRVSKASPNLFLSVAQGAHINKATLYIRKSTGKSGQQEYMTITMEGVFLSAHTLSGTGGQGGGGNELPVESISLNFAKIKFEYKPQNDNGSLGAAVTGAYNIQENQVI